MKRWHIRTGGRKMTCSLLNFNGKAQMAVFNCGDKNINVLFSEFFDFAKSKAGRMISARMVGRNGNSIVTINFK